MRTRGTHRASQAPAASGQASASDAGTRFSDACGPSEPDRSRRVHGNGTVTDSGGQSEDDGHYEAVANALLEDLKPGNDQPRTSSSEESEAE